MKLYSKIMLAVALAVLVPVSGCKKALDINQDPNRVTKVTADLLLPSIEVFIANTLGVNFQIYGGIWGQYWTQNPNSSQYREIERYQPTAPDFDRPWTNLYAGAGSDLRELEALAVANHQQQYQAIALLLRAYMFQMITDAWGDVPYTEALRGAPEDGGIVNPRYDPQAEVYNNIIALVDQGLSLIDVADPSAPGSDDLIFGGDMSMWEKFGNTLKLRMLLRLAYVDPGKAQAGIAALNGASFLDIGEDAQISYTASSPNPLYAEMVGNRRTQNLVASSTAIDSMNSNDDPRIGVFYEPTSTGVYAGIKQGNFNTTVPAGSYSIPSTNVGGDAQNDASATAPVKLLTGYESKFLQAEAVARGWLGGSSSAQTLFEEGIFANFESWGLSDSAAMDYIANSYWGMYPSGGSLNAQIRHIITQKWFSMAGNQCFEAWTEWRRTGYPDFFIMSEEAIINSFPVRFLYPDLEITRNFNFPGTKAVTDRVWWDVN